MGGTGKEPSRAIGFQRQEKTEVKGFTVIEAAFVLTVICLMAFCFVSYGVRGRHEPMGYSGRITGDAVFNGCKLLAEGVYNPVDNATNAEFFTCFGAIAVLGETMAKHGDYCPPDKATNGEVTQAAVSYMQAHPAHLDAPFGEIIYTALKQKWPCDGRGL